MMRVTVLAVSITLLFASSEVQCSNAYPSATIEIIQNGTEYLKANPNARLLTPSFSYQSTLGNELLYYRFGNRNSGNFNKSFFDNSMMMWLTSSILFLGDSLLADYFASQRWGSAMDVSSTVNYPPSGMGAKITFFQVFVDQVR